MKISHMKKDELFEGFYLIKSADLRQTRAGKNYLAFTFQDDSGEIDGKLWDAQPHNIEAFTAGKVVHMKGRREVYNNTPQVNQITLRLPQAGEPNDPADFKVKSPVDVKEIRDYMSQMIFKIENPVWQRIVRNLYTKYDKPTPFQRHGGWSSAFADEEGMRKDNREWQTFTEERLANTDSFYIMSNVDNFSDGVEVDLDGNRLSDYTPSGNVIYVSPRYLIEEKITVSSEFMDKMQNLSEGEFGLILPESLREQSAYYQGLFTDYLQNFSSESVEVTSQKHYLPQVRLAFTETGQERFLYNDGYKTTRQYLKDPIIVVLTPQATGTRPVAGMLWGTTANSALKLDRYGDSITALKEQGLYHKVSYLVKSQLFFAKVLNDKRVEFYSLLIGTILTLSTAILLFDSMNLLYFEQFRRELMIKRLAGMTIYELHGKYLLAQGGVLLLGLVLSSILTRDGLISALVVALFTLNALLILVRQDKKEEAGSMAVLKGK
ncbi:immunity protein [Streptococcus pneumoniae]|nr:immunity protein [Streptococcus pneumoniae]